MAVRMPPMRVTLAVVLVAAVLALAWIFLLPLRGGTTVRLLVVPRTDAGDAAQAAQVLAEVVESSDFFTKVAAQDPQISWAGFGDTDAARRSRWHKAVEARVDRRTGIVTLTIRHRDKELAGRIAQAAADVLTRRGGEYLAGSPQVVLLDPALGQ